MEAKRFPHDHTEGRYTRYHLWDEETQAPWCTTAKHDIFKTQPLTIEDFTIRTVKVAPRQQMCQTCMRRWREFNAAVKLINERGERIKQEFQRSFF